MSGSTIMVSPPVLEARTRECLVEAGLSEEGAVVTARVLVDADVRGHRSHGVGMLPTYLDRIEQGGIDVSAQPEWCESGAGTAVLDARGAIGPVAAALASARCAEVAGEAGVSAVSIRGNNHVGMLAAYRTAFVEHGVIGLIFNMSGNSVAPPHAQFATMGNNALCLVVPSGRSGPFVIDLATGIVAGGKIRQAAREGESVPRGWLLDREGRETTDPRHLDEGGSIPVFGGHRGLAVSLMTELLVGCLSVGHGSSRVMKQRVHPDLAMDCGQLFVGFDPGAFGGVNSGEVVEELERSVARGYRDQPQEPWFPDQLEAASRSNADRCGIPLTATLADLLGLGDPDPR
jgi:LDH2 family malate/lactate/ureidoglycolate dehydrogenase